MSLGRPKMTAPVSEAPEIAWWRGLFRSRSHLRYWLDGQQHEAWVMRFEEKNDHCIIFQDYATKKTSVIKSHKPITYMLTEAR